MSRIEVQDCSCIDYPCCGCGPVEVFTGQDALERAREDEDAQDILDRDEDDGHDNPGEDMDGDFDTAMASAGFGMDEDYCPGSQASWEDQFEG